MRASLDVNVLIATIDAVHSLHERASVPLSAIKSAEKRQLVAR